MLDTLEETPPSYSWELRTSLVSGLPNLDEHVGESPQGQPEAASRPVAGVDAAQQSFQRIERMTSVDPIRCAIQSRRAYVFLARWYQAAIGNQGATGPKFYFGTHWRHITIASRLFRGMGKIQDSTGVQSHLAEHPKEHCVGTGIASALARKWKFYRRLFRQTSRQSTEGPPRGIGHREVRELSPCRSRAADIRSQ